MREVAGSTAQVALLTTSHTRQNSTSTSKVLVATAYPPKMAEMSWTNTADTKLERARLPSSTLTGLRIMVALPLVEVPGHVLPDGDGNDQVGDHGHQAKAHLHQDQHGLHSH